MHVEFGARGSVRLYGLAGVVLGELLKAVEDLLRDQAALLDPALDAAVGAHSDETLLPLEHFHPVAVVDGPDLTVHGGDPVTEAGFRCRDVHVLMLGDSGALAGGRSREQQKGRTRHNCSEKIRAGRVHRYHISL